MLHTELKELVSMHGTHAAGEDKLTLDETTIIRGALDMQAKTARDAMTPLDKGAPVLPVLKTLRCFELSVRASVFTIGMDTELNREILEKLKALGHSRIPVYEGDKQNLVGMFRFLCHADQFFSPRHIMIPLSLVEYQFSVLTYPQVCC
jgi:CBS domain containing-hemolysin-like protein